MKKFEFDFKDDRFVSNLVFSLDSEVSRIQESIDKLKNDCDMAMIQFQLAFQDHAETVGLDTSMLPDPDVTLPDYEIDGDKIVAGD